TYGAHRDLHSFPTRRSSDLSNNSVYSLTTHNSCKCFMKMPNIATLSLSLSLSHRHRQTDTHTHTHTHTHTPNNLAGRGKNSFRSPLGSRVANVVGRLRKGFSFFSRPDNCC